MPTTATSTAADTQSTPLRKKGDIAVVAYEPRYKEVFKTLNEQWITRHWRIEPHDLAYLKLGFRELPELHPAYERGDIQMELKLTAP